MTTIWRYPLPMTDRVTLDMPKGARPLSVGPFRQPAHSGAYCVDRPLDLWVVVDPTRPSEPRTFLVVGTGNPMPLDAGEYVGTTHSHGGRLIWHVFDTGESGWDAEIEAHFRVLRERFAAKAKLRALLKSDEQDPR